MPQEDLIIHIIKTGTYFNKDDLNDKGIPIQSLIYAEVEIENPGNKAGELEWKVDLESSKLPAFFSVIKKDGEFYSNPPLKIDGGYTAKYMWELKFVVKENPELFTKMLKDENEFKIIFNYHTKWIGGVSKEENLIISGDFSSYKKKLIELWAERGLTNLVDLLQ